MHKVDLFDRGLIRDSCFPCFGRHIHGPKLSADISLSQSIDVGMQLWLRFANIPFVKAFRCLSHFPWQIIVSVEHIPARMDRQRALGNDRRWTAFRFRIGSILRYQARTQRQEQRSCEKYASRLDWEHSQDFHNGRFRYGK